MILRPHDNRIVVVLQLSSYHLHIISGAFTSNYITWNLMLIYVLAFVEITLSWDKKHTKNNQKAFIVTISNIVIFQHMITITSYF